MNEDPRYCTLCKRTISGGYYCKPGEGHNAADSSGYDEFSDWCAEHGMRPSSPNALRDFQASRPGAATEGREAPTGESAAGLDARKELGESCSSQTPVVPRPAHLRADALSGAEAREPDPSRLSVGPDEPSPPSPGPALTSYFAGRKTA